MVNNTSITGKPSNSILSNTTALVNTVNNLNKKVELIRPSVPPTLQIIFDRIDIPSKDADEIDNITVTSGGTDETLIYYSKQYKLFFIYNVVTFEFISLFNHIFQDSNGNQLAHISNVMSSFDLSEYIKVIEEENNNNGSDNEIEAILNTYSNFDKNLYVRSVTDKFKGYTNADISIYGIGDIVKEFIDESYTETQQESDSLDTSTVIKLAKIPIAVVTLKQL